MMPAPREPDASGLPSSHVIGVSANGREELTPSRRTATASPPGRGLTCLIEFAFATVRRRTKVAKRPGSKAAGLATTFKLIEPTRQTAGASSTHRTSSRHPRWSDFHQRALTIALRHRRVRQ
jgi:hypothetical protein